MADLMEALSGELHLQVLAEVVQAQELQVCSPIAEMAVEYRENLIVAKMYIRIEDEQTVLTVKYKPGGQGIESKSTGFPAL